MMSYKDIIQINGRSKISNNPDVQIPYNPIVLKKYNKLLKQFLGNLDLKLKGIGIQKKKGGDWHSIF